MDKSPDAFRTISEVADDLELPQHVLRFWEGRFAQIRPLKRGGGRRYYRPDDVDLLRGIRHLLYGEGYTIRGVQRILKDQGVRFVMEVWREGAPGVAQIATGGPRDDDDAFAMDDMDAFDAPEPVPPPAALGGRDREQLDASAASIAQRFAPRIAEDMAPARLTRQPPPQVARTVGHPVAPAEPQTASRIGTLIGRLRPGADGEETGGAPASGRLGRDEIKHLQATLFELLECKRLLDSAR